MRILILALLGLAFARPFFAADPVFTQKTGGKRNAVIILDTSYSMQYEGVFEDAKAAAIKILDGLDASDAAGLILFDEDLRQTIPPRSSQGHLHSLLTVLEQTAPSSSTAFDKALHAVADQQQRRGFVVLISDLLSDADQLTDALRHFRFNGHEVLIIHVLDPQEVAFNFDDLIHVRDLETGTRLLVEGSSARTLYQKNFQRFQQRIQHACGLLGIDYTLITTDQPLDTALFEYLAARSR